MALLHQIQANELEPPEPPAAQDPPERPLGEMYVDSSKPAVYNYPEGAADFNAASPLAPPTASRASLRPRVRGGCSPTAWGPPAAQQRASPSPGAAPHPPPQPLPRPSCTRTANRCPITWRTSRRLCGARSRPSRLLQVTRAAPPRPRRWSPRAGCRREGAGRGCARGRERGPQAAGLGARPQPYSSRATRGLAPPGLGLCASRVFRESFSGPAA